MYVCQGVMVITPMTLPWRLAFWCVHMCLPLPMTHKRLHFLSGQMIPCFCWHFLLGRSKLPSCWVLLWVEIRLSLFGPFSWKTICGWGWYSDSSPSLQHAHHSLSFALNQLYGFHLTWVVQIGTVESWPFQAILLFPFFCHSPHAWNLKGLLIYIVWSCNGFQRQCIVCGLDDRALVSRSNWITNR